MKLIIDIPEEVVTAIRNGGDYRYDIHTAIAQGIPYEERPHGKWIPTRSWDNRDIWVCSKCGNQNRYGITVEKACWCCGADMRGKEKKNE
jgi:hypothetical protein